MQYRVGKPSKWRDLDFDSAGRLAKKQALWPRGKRPTPLPVVPKDIMSPGSSVK